MLVRQKIYKGPIIEVRGMIRLVLACAPFLAARLFTENMTLWSVGFLCAAFATASFVGMDEKNRRARYPLWVMGFLIAAVFSAWAVAERPLMTGTLLLFWSTISSISLVAGPVASMPVSIGCIVYILLLLGNRMAGQSFLHLLPFVVGGVGWAYILGRVSWLRGAKNTLDIPSFREAYNTMRRELSWQSTYARTGLIRGLIIVALAIALFFGADRGLIITAFTVLIAMQPGHSQTLLKVASRVASAVGAVVAAAYVFNAQPPYWVYFIAAGAALAFARWILLRSYTYNSFFLITFPLFLLSLGGYSEVGVEKVWYTVLGGMIAVIASELFVFRRPSAPEPAAA